MVGNHTDQFFHHLQPQIVREEANKNHLEGIQNDEKKLLDQSLIPDVYFTIGLLSPSSKIRNKI